MNALNINAKQADQDLDVQQQHLASINYDLRITNLARFIHKKIKKYIVKTSSSKIRLIDIGAGNGLFLKFFKNHSIKVSAIELEHENVENMKKDPHLDDVDIRQGNITNISGNEEYDVVISSDVIEHIQDDQKAMQQLWTFVAPGGMLIITVPAHSMLYGKRDVAWGHFRRYDKDSLKEKIANALSLRESDNIRSNPIEQGDRYAIARDDKNYSIEFITFWNTVGFFVYFIYEKILHKPINETMRYSNSPMSRVVKSALDKILRLEESTGGTLFGLTLIVGVRKSFRHDKE
ncbi:hypothetical protein BH09PAT2_BH09PAT2_04620 [soil metagenome]